MCVCVFICGYSAIGSSPATYRQLDATECPHWEISANDFFPTENSTVGGDPCVSVCVCVCLCVRVGVWMCHTRLVEEQQIRVGASYGRF